MPKKQRHETQKEQSERFKKAAQEMIDAGELNPTAAEDIMDKLVKAETKKGRKTNDSSD